MSSAPQPSSVPIVNEKTAGPFVIGTARLDSVDLLRGLIMVIMALDHTRDYFTHLRFQPEDIRFTWGMLFFTRWITHFCAPVFFFLAGTGAFLSKKTGAELSRFLVDARPVVDRAGVHTLPLRVDILIRAFRCAAGDLVSGRMHGGDVCTGAVAAEVDGDNQRGDDPGAQRV